MPRSSEVIPTEKSTTAPRSPLRRSCRIIAVSSPVPFEANTIKGRRLSANREVNDDEEKPQTARGKRGSSVNKEIAESHTEPAKTRSRRSSTSSESSTKTETVSESAKPIRGRRSSVNREEETKKPVRGRRNSTQEDIEEEVKKPIRGRRSSVQDEKNEEEVPAKKIRGRRSSAQEDKEEESLPRNTRSRRSVSRELEELGNAKTPKNVKSANEKENTDDTESKRTTRSRRLSMDAEEEVVTKPVKTPMKPKRRPSISEAAVLEPIDEKEDETENSTKNENQVSPETNHTKNKDLYIICESSFVDENEHKSDETENPSKNKNQRSVETAQITNEDSKTSELYVVCDNLVDESELKLVSPSSPIISKKDETPIKEKIGNSKNKRDEPGGGRQTPDSTVLRKSPRIQEKLEKCKSGEHTPHKKCLCDEDCSKKASSERIVLEEKNAQNKSSPTHRKKSTLKNGDHEDDEVFTSELIDVKKSETKSLISDGSDGSFQLNLSKSKYETTESEADMNDSKTSDNSDKENISTNLENPKTSVIVDQNITVNRVSNVFRPKYIDYSFIEPMEVDTTLNLDASKLEKSHVKLKESSIAEDETVDDTLTVTISDTHIEISSDKSIVNGIKTVENSDLMEHTGDEESIDEISNENKNSKSSDHIEDIESEKENGEESVDEINEKKDYTEETESDKETSEESVTEITNENENPESTKHTEETEKENVEGSTVETINENENPKSEEHTEETQPTKGNDEETVKAINENNNRKNKERIETTELENYESKREKDEANSETQNENSVDKEKIEETYAQKGKDQKITSTDSSECDVEKSEYVAEETNNTKDTYKTKDANDTYSLEKIVEPVNKEGEESSSITKVLSNRETNTKDSVSVGNSPGRNDDSNNEKIHHSPKKHSVIVEIKEEIEEEDDRFSETKDDVFNESREDDRFSESKDMSEDYEFNLPSDVDRESPVIDAQPIENEDKEQPVLLHQDQSSEKMSCGEQDEEIDVETCDSTDANAIKDGGRSTEDTNKLVHNTNSNCENTQTELLDSVANPKKSTEDENVTEDILTENAIICTEDNEVKDQTSSTNAVESAEDSNVVKEKDAYDEMEKSFQDIVRNEEQNQSMKLKENVVEETKIVNEAVRKSKVAKVDDKELLNISHNMVTNTNNTKTRKSGAADLNIIQEKTIDSSNELNSVNTSAGSHELSENSEENDSNKKVSNTGSSDLTKPPNNQEEIRTVNSSIMVGLENIDPELEIENHTNEKPDSNNTQPAELLETSSHKSTEKKKKRKSGFVESSEEQKEAVGNSSSMDLESDNVQVQKITVTSAKKGKKRNSRHAESISTQIESDEIRSVSDNKEENAIDKVSQTQNTENAKNVSKRLSGSKESASGKNPTNEESVEFSLASWFGTSTDKDLTENTSEDTAAKVRRNKKKKKRSITEKESPESSIKETEPLKLSPESKSKHGKVVTSEKFLEEYADSKLDAKLAQFLKGVGDEESEDEESEDEESEDGESEDVESEGSELDNSFLDDMAEEGEEDTPSEDSNAIIDEGEAINTDSERSDDEECGDDDSFICDEADVELLPGEEYDLDENKKKSRIINVENRDEDVIKIERKPKPEPKKKKSRIIKVEDSSDDEEVILISDKEESFKQTSTDAVDVSLKKETNEKNATEKRSIRIIENLDVKEIRDAALSERINKLVDTFCTTIPQKGDLSMNLSLEYANTTSPEVKKKSRKRRPRNRKRKSTSEEETVPIKVQKLSENVPTQEKKLNLSLTEDTSSESDKRLKSRLSKSFDHGKNSKKHKRSKQKNKSKGKGNSLNISTQEKKLHLSLTEGTSSESEKGLKRRLSKSFDVGENIKKLKKSKQRDRSKGEGNLERETFGLMNQLITDVKNRSRRIIQPSTNMIDHPDDINRPRRQVKPTSTRGNMDSAWTVELDVKLKPSTSTVSEKEVKEFKKQKFHPKDFRNQMLYDSSRVRRIETKDLLRKKGAYS